MKRVVLAVVAAAAIIFSIVSSAKDMIASAQKLQAQAIAVIEGQQDKGGGQ